MLQKLYVAGTSIVCLFKLKKYFCIRKSPTKYKEMIKPYKICYAWYVLQKKYDDFLDNKNANLFLYLY